MAADLTPTTIDTSRKMAWAGMLFLAPGLVVVGAHVVILVLSLAAVSGWLGATWQEDAAKLWTAMIISTILAPLFGSVLLFLGDMVRRGVVTPNRNARQDTLLPQGTNASLWRLVAPGWNLLWLVVSAAGAAVLIVAASDQALAHRGDLGGRAWLIWSLNAMFLAGFAGQNLGTWLKKTAWARRPEAALYAARAQEDSTPVLRQPVVMPIEGEHPAVRIHRLEEEARVRRDEPESPEVRSQARWRAWSFRWRYDVWCCALGAVSLIMVPMWQSLSVATPGSEESVAVLLWVQGVAGVVLLVVGLMTVTQFWRSGEDLAAGESLA